MDFALIMFVLLLVTGGIWLLDRFALAARYLSGWRIQLDRILQGPRKIKLDGRAVPHLAIDAEMTMASLGEAVDHGKSQAGPLSDRLGGEERINRFSHHLGRPVSETLMTT